MNIQSLAPNSNYYPIETNKRKISEISDTPSRPSLPRKAKQQRLFAKKVRAEPIVLNSNDDAVVLRKLPKTLRRDLPFGTKETVKIVKAILKNSTLAPLPKQAVRLKAYQTALKVGKGIPSDIAICRINDEIGLGVFRKLDQETLKSGTFIGIYPGEYKVLPSETKENAYPYAFTVFEDAKLTKKQIESLGEKKDKKESIKGKKKTPVEYRVLLDGKPESNFTSLINHSKKPNVEAKLYRIGDIVAPVLFAIRNIKPGQQYVMDYGKWYWRILGITPKDMNAQSYVLGQLDMTLSEEMDPLLFNSEESDPANNQEDNLLFDISDETLDPKKGELLDLMQVGSYFGQNIKPISASLDEFELPEEKQIPSGLIGIIDGHFYSSRKKVLRPVHLKSEKEPTHLVVDVTKRNRFIADFSYPEITPTLIHMLQDLDKGPEQN